jgi:hypothetical protein
LTIIARTGYYGKRQAAWHRPACRSRRKTRLALRRRMVDKLTPCYHGFVLLRSTSFKPIPSRSKSMPVDVKFLFPVVHVPNPHPSAVKFVFLADFPSFLPITKKVFSGHEKTSPF